MSGDARNYEMAVVPVGEDSYVSKHASACFNCGEQGHNKADCTEPPKNTGECYNCGEVGHNKADCVNPRVERAFTGECRHCGAEGHRAADCPTAPARICKACGGEGHIAAECNNARLVYDDSVPMLPPEQGWEMLIKADKAKEVILIKEALNIYTRAMPELTFVDMEKELREAGLNIHLIAKEQEISDTMTIVNLQGKKDCKYVISFQFSYKPTRPKFSAGWPSSPEDNLTRLADAGYVKDRMVPKCRNCDELGHISKNCPQERVEREKTEIKCGNCKEVGHYLRDCPEPRQDRNACRNCGQGGHKASDCTEPRNMDNMDCRNCGEKGHMSRDCPTREAFTCRNCGGEGHKASDCTEERKMTCRKCNEDGHMARDCPNAPVQTCLNCNAEGHMRRDCPEPPNPANMKCRNCDAMGHSSRECPKPRDYSRIQCRNCGEFGHTKTRCKKPVPEEMEAGDMATDAGTSTGGGADWENAPPAEKPSWASGDTGAADGGSEWKAGGGAGDASW